MTHILRMEEEDEKSYRRMDTQIPLTGEERERERKGKREGESTSSGQKHKERKFSNVVCLCIKSLNEATSERKLWLRKTSVDETMVM